MTDYIPAPNEPESSAKSELTGFIELRKGYEAYIQDLDSSNRVAYAQIETYLAQIKSIRESIKLMRIKIADNKALRSDRVERLRAVRTLIRLLEDEDLKEPKGNDDENDV